jgi:uncharacterized protein (TIGR02444 family)
MSAFFDYSLAVYGRAGVAEQCLALQDREGLDVNLLLFCLWAASRGRTVDGREMDRLIDAAAPWQRDVVATFRALRRWLKDRPVAAAGEAATLRENAKRRELEAEEIEQRRLEACLEMPAGAEPDPAIAAANLSVYLARAGCPLGKRVRADLATLLAAAWSGVDRGAAADLFDD